MLTWCRVHDGARDEQYFCHCMLLDVCDDSWYFAESRDGTHCLFLCASSQMLCQLAS